MAGSLAWAFHSADGVMLYPMAGKPERVARAAPRPGGYFDSFVREIAGQTEGLTLTTPEILASSRLALQVRRAADEGLRDVACL